MNDVWREEDSPLQKWGGTFPSIKDIWAKIMTKKPIQTQDFCALIFRNIWHRRNTFIFKNVFAGPKQVVESVKITRGLL